MAWAAVKGGGCTSASFATRFQKLSRAEREEVVLGGLKGAEMMIPSQRMRENCPELTLEGLCGGRGEGWGKLVGHFTVDPLGEGWGNYPLLVHEGMWKMLEIGGEDELVPRSSGQRAYQVHCFRGERRS